VTAASKPHPWDGDFAVSEETRDEATLFRVRGEVDVSTASIFRDDLARAVDRGDPRVVVDLSGVTFMDSSGLGVLVGALRRMRDDGRTLRVIGLNPTTRRLFDATGLAEAFGVHSP
jgi:anti-sigma B factor antagonist